MMSFKVVLALVVCHVCFIHCYPGLSSSRTDFNLYSRSEWQALPPTQSTPLNTPVPYVVIHHTYKPDACSNHKACVAAMHSMQNYHMNSLGWGDIGYNFCIGNTGDVYEGRGWRTKGVHAGPANGLSVGICLIGDWRVEEPPTAMLKATQELIQLGVEEGAISPKYLLVGHSQVMATECPGTALLDIISKWDHFSTNFTGVHS